MKDLGLVFLEDDNRKCRLTLIGEELVKGNITFVDAMRLQLKRYQYPSAAVWSGSGSVDHSIKVHPFQFMFRLLREPRLENTLTMEEMIDTLKGLVFNSFERTTVKERQALDMAIQSLTAISKLSKSLKSIDRYEMDENTLIGFNMAVALFNKHFAEFKEEKAE